MRFLPVPLPISSGRDEGATRFWYNGIPEWQRRQVFAGDRIAPPGGSMDSILTS
jgi:hypothetical protein